MKLKILKKKNSQDSFSFIREVPIENVSVCNLVEMKVKVHYQVNETSGCFVSDYFEHDSW